MKTEFWVALSAKKRGIVYQCQGTPKAYRSKPITGKDQVAIRISCDIPDSYFEEPQIAFDLKLPPKEKSRIIGADMQANMAKLLQEQLGVKVHLSVGEGDK